MEVSLAPQILELGPFQFSNAAFTALFLTLIFALLAIYATRKFSLVPTRLQISLELILDFVTSQLSSSFRSKQRARKFTPFILTLLLFLVIANQLSVVPLVGQIVLSGKPIFRTVTAHLSATVALALMVLVCAHAIALYLHPLKHLGNYFKLGDFLKVRSWPDLGQAIISNFLAILDIIGEAAKVLSLSFRLFGNIFAGELMIAVIAGISAYTKLILPVPFMALSIFSGFIQAAVFTMLSVQFMAGTIESVVAEENPGSPKQSYLDPPKLATETLPA